jgi:hypothetical protein
MTNYGYC